jgi:hypothetical protein
MEDDTGIRPPSFVLHRFYFATTFALDNQYIPVHDCSIFVTPAATSGMCVIRRLTMTARIEAMMLHLRESKHDI